MYNKQKERLYEASHNDDGFKRAHNTGTNSYGYPLADPRQLTMRYSESLDMAAETEARRSTNYRQSSSSDPLEQSVYYTNSQQYEEEQMKSFDEIKKEPESECAMQRDRIKYQQALPESSERDRNKRNYAQNPNLSTLPSKNREVDRSNNICIKTVPLNDVRKCPQNSRNDAQQSGKRKRNPGQEQTIKNKVVRVSIGETPTTSPQKPSPVSATLFLELSSDRRLKLQEMADKFSSSLDSNTCKNVLDEVEFLLKLFCTASKNEYVTPEEESDDPLFYNATEQIDFVIKVIIAQLDKLFVNLPKCIIQLIIDNYPHRILQRAKKQIDNWMIAQETTKLLCATMETPAHANLMEKVPIEKYERSSFSSEIDYRAFCRQRDIYYTIRTNWAKMLSNDANSDVPPSEVVTVPKSLDSFHAKTRQLFQISRTPTSIFRLASLFISHYLIVERIQEETNVSKDNNVQKGLSPGSKQILEFQKHFLLSSTPIFLQHVVDKLLVEIMEAEQSMGAANVIADQIKLCRMMKDIIYLARLLGLALFLPYITEENTAGSIGMDPAESLRIRNYQGPPLDLINYMEKALKSGRLTSTCPWIVEYLLNCDSVALLLPSYQPVLSKLLFIYKRVLITSSTCHAISTTNRNFLRFYFGMLFSSNKCPGSVFASENLGCNLNVIEDSLKETDGRVDLLDGIGRSMIEYFFHSSFNRFRRILGWRILEFPIGDRAFTGNEFQHILSLVEADNFTTTPSNDESTNPRLQSQLEAAFFESYSPSVKRNVEFIAESVWSNFLIFTKAELLPYFKNLAINQALFGEEAAKKCRERLGEEMNMHMPQRCITAVKVCLEQMVPPDISQLCWRIALQKAKKNGRNWINTYIKAEMFPKDGKSSFNPQDSSQTPGKLEEEGPPAEILRLIHDTTRKMHLRQYFDHKSIDKILSCPNLVNFKSFNLIADWTFTIIAFHPRILGLHRMTKVVYLWKRLSPKEAKIINPRNLMLINQTGFTEASWFKIGKLTQMLLREGVLTPSELEQQCLELSRKCWCDTKEKKLIISDYLTLVMDTFKKKNVEVEPGPSTSTQG